MHGETVKPKYETVHLRPQFCQLSHLEVKNCLIILHRNISNRFLITKCCEECLEAILHSEEVAVIVTGNFYSSFL